MYSMIMMMAMSTAPADVDFGRRGCHGCCGGCWSSCYGCCGGCYGGWSSCHGCCGGYGGWSSCSGCCGGYGGCYGGGCFGGGCFGTPVMGVTPMTTTPMGGTTTPMGGTTKPEGMTTGPAPARLLVSLPADAKLLIDDNPTKQTSASRVFVTPPLQPGKTYAYTLTAERMSEGKPQRVSQEVTVRAGVDSQVNLSFSAVQTASAR